MAIVTRGQKLVYGERGGQEVQIVQLLAGPVDGPGDRITVPQGLRESRLEEVLDDQSRGRHGRDPGVHLPEVALRVDIARHDVVALFEGDEMNVRPAVR